MRKKMKKVKTITHKDKEFEITSENGKFHVKAVSKNLESNLILMTEVVQAIKSGRIKI